MMAQKRQFKPGSFGCHEALHMASFLCEAVNTELLNHSSVKANRKWKVLAKKAVDSLADLYQAIGAEHFK